MLKRDTFWEDYGVFLLILALLVAGCFALSSTPACPDAATQAQQQEGGKCPDEDLPARFFVASGDAPVGLWGYVGAVVTDHPEAITAAATVSIAFFTIVLAIATWRLWRSTDKLGEATLIAAKAAQDAAEALPIVERAHVFLTVEHSNIEHAITTANGSMIVDVSDGNHISGPLIPEVRFRLRNVGKTPAIIRDIRAGLTYETADEATFAYMPWVQFRAGFIAAGDGTEPLTVATEDVMSAIVASEIWGAGRHLYFVGCVTYEDIFEDEHDTAWVWRCDRHGNLEEWGGKACNRRT